MDSKVTLEWCMQDECEKVKSRETRDKIQKDRMNFANELTAKGHECIFYMESYPGQIGWCHQTPCSKAKKTTEQTMHEENADLEQFAEKLRLDGHTCVSIGETFPIKVFWCETEPCSHQK